MSCNVLFFISVVKEVNPNPTESPFQPGRSRSRDDEMALYCAWVVKLHATTWPTLIFSRTLRTPSLRPGRGRLGAAGREGIKSPVLRTFRTRWRRKCQVRWRKMDGAADVHTWVWWTIKVQFMYVYITYIFCNLLCVCVRSWMWNGHVAFFSIFIGKIPQERRADDVKMQLRFVPLYRRQVRQRKDPV